MLIPRITSVMLSRQPDQTAEWLNRLNAKVTQVEKEAKNKGTSPSPAGVTSYNDLTDKPQINGNTLVGNKSFADLGLIAIVDAEIDAILNSI